MPRFFSENIENDVITLSKEDEKHITKVLRYKTGDTVTVCDKNGTDYICEVNNFTDEFSLKTLTKQKNNTEPSCKITLYQALPKSDKMEFIIKKAVELGVTRVVPILTKYCVSRPTKEDFAKKLVRYQKIAYEASKQCGRGIIPEICQLETFENAVTKRFEGQSILYYEKGGENTNRIIRQDTTNCNLFIGSEGGFFEEEIEFAKKNDIKIGTLGKLILRCETAPIVSISLVLNATGNM
ncbi:MAG: RsmE family RNA methyltransferase [Oscillospiraceae bacterium]